MSSSRTQARVGADAVPAAYPRHLEKTFFTTRGQKLFVRPVLPGDAPLLRQGFSRLSPASVFQRFHGHVKSLSDETCRYLTQIDYRSHLALIALDPERDAGIGIARYCILPGDDLAEAALVVVDEWQSRGVGRSLLDQLVVGAREQGITGFQARVLSENRRMMRILRHSGHAMHVEQESGVVYLRLLFDGTGVRPLGV